jgi:hypothetical protein
MADIGLQPSRFFFDGASVDGRISEEQRQGGERYQQERRSEWQRQEQEEEGT